MNPTEELLRDVLREAAGDTTPPPGALDQIKAAAEAAQRRRRNKALTVWGAAVAASVIGFALFLATNDERQRVEVVPPATNETIEPAPAIAVAVTARGDVVLLDVRTGDHLRTLASSVVGDVPSALALSQTNVAIAGDRVFFDRIDGSSLGSAGLWQVRRTGGAPELVAEHGASPAVSADGSRLAFVYREPASLYSMIVVRDLATGEERRWQWAVDDADQLRTQGRIWHLAWSPDGRSLAFVSSSRDAVLRVLDLSAATLSESVPHGTGLSPAWLGPGMLVYVHDCCYPEHDQPRALITLNVETGDVTETVDGSYRAVDVNDAGQLLVVDDDGLLVDGRRIPGDFLAAAW